MLLKPPNSKSNSDPQLSNLSKTTKTNVKGKYHQNLYSFKGWRKIEWNFVYLLVHRWLDIQIYRPHGENHSRWRIWGLHETKLCLYLHMASGCIAVYQYFKEEEETPYLNLFAKCRNALWSFKAKPVRIISCWNLFIDFFFL